MAKKAVETVEVESVKVEKVLKLDADFNREDLNSLRNKINEIVDIINSL